MLKILKSTRKYNVGIQQIYYNATYNGILFMSLLGSKLERGSLSEMYF